MARSIVFAADLGALIASTGSRDGIRWGAPADRHALVGGGVSARWLDRVIDNGLRFVVADENGRVIGHDIYLTGDKVRQFRWLVVGLRPGHDVLSTNAFVVPERRGQGLLGDMQRFAARTFVEEGYRRMISVVGGRNAAAIRAQAHLGAIPLLALTRVRIGRLIVVWRGGLIRHVGWDGQPFALTI